MFTKANNLSNLPSNECYNIIQDKKGYIWFSTDRGLCKFDGKELKTYSSKQGLPEESCYGLTNDEKGKIWVFTSNNRLLYVLKDSLLEHPLSKQLSSELNKKNLLATYFKTEGDSLIWIGTQLNTYKVNLYNKSIVKIQGYTSNHIMVFKLRDNLLVPFEHTSNVSSREQLNNKTLSLGIINNDNVTTYFNVKHSINAMPNYRIHSCRTKNGDLIIGFTNQIITINNKNKVETKILNGDVLCIYTDKEENLWVGTRKDGLYFFPAHKLKSNSVIHSLKNFSISGIWCDSQNSIWCSTIEDGIYHTQNTYCLQYSNIITKPLSLIKNCDNKLFIASGTNQIDVLNPDGQHTSYTHKFNLSNITDIEKWGNNFLISSKDFVCSANSDFTLFKYWYLNGFKANILSHSNQLIKINERVFGYQALQINEYVNNKINELTTQFPEKIRGIAPLKNDILLWTKSGVYKFDLDSKKQIQLAKINKTNKVLVLDGSTLLICTTKDGVFLLKSGIITPLKLPIDFQTANFKDVCIDENNIIWFATNKGLLNLKFEKNTEKYELFTLEQGYPFVDCKSIQIYNHKVFINSNDKLYSIPTNIKIETHTPNFFLKHVYANNNIIVPKNKTYEFKSNETSIKIEFEYLNYFHKESTNKIAYKFEGIDSAYTYSTTTEILFNKLSPGEYKVSFFPVYGKKIIFNKPEIIIISISKPIWITLPFILMYVLIAIAIIYCSVKIYITQFKKIEKKKAEQIQLIADYKMAAIRAQMNPHFIFNCINSIQRYILTSSPKEAYKYLSDFGKLIRLVLDHSDENLISLKQELNMVDLYVKMEQLRFEDAFEFIIENTSAINADDFYLPPMMLQPYIENAIWHGIMGLENKRKGIIKLSYSITNNQLLITIEDNGVGRTEASKHSKKDHKSKAIALNNKRIDTLNQFNSSSTDSISIEDVLDLNKNIIGTIVNIKISQQYEN